MKPLPGPPAGAGDIRKEEIASGWPLAYSQERKIKLSRQIVNLFQYKLHDVTNVITILAQT